MSDVPHDHAGLVWTGRLTDGAAGGPDGRPVDDAELASALDRAREVRVLDPLDFPWDLLEGRRDLPLTVRLPEDLPADDVDALLGRPLLRHLSRHDRLATSRAEHRAVLAARHDLPDEVWLPVDAAVDGGPDHGAPEERLRAKRVERQLAAEVAGELARSGRDGHDDVVEVHGDHAPVAALRRASRCRVRRAGAATDDLVVPSPQVALVWLRDGGQPPRERVADLRAAVRSLAAGRRLVVVGFVVDLPGGPPNPSAGLLVEELDAVAHGGLHVEEVRSVRLGDERWSRAVLLAATRLGPEEAW